MKINKSEVASFDKTKIKNDLVGILGKQWVYDDEAILDSYAWQMNAEILTGSHFMPRAIAVALPASTLDVSRIMAYCRRAGIQAKPMGSGQGPWNAPRRENNSVLLDLRRMDRIIEIDRDNMYALVEPYVTNNQLQTAAMRLGLNCHIIGAGGQASQLAAATSFNGHGPDGIACGFAGRNLLGFEWVLPDGEIIQVGSYNASGKFFSGDGCGPSLRGVIRGFAGAMGGLGVFTRAAVQLFPWTGPAALRVSGRSPDYIAEIPRHHTAGMFVVPDWPRLGELGYELGGAKIAAYALRNSPSLSVPGLYSSGAEAVKGLAIPFFRILDKNLFLILVADSAKQRKYQLKVLRVIGRGLGGGFLGNDGGFIGLSNKIAFLRVVVGRIGIKGLIASVPGLLSLAARQVRAHGWRLLKRGNPLNAIMYLKFTRADSNVKATVALGGNFSTSLGTISPWDMAVRSCQVGKSVKKEFIRDRLIVDDGGDGGHGGLYEGGAYSHIETVALYDPNDERQVNAQRRFIEATNRASVAENLGISINSFGPAGSEFFSPLAMHYDAYIQKVKRAIDPTNTADAGWYTDSSFQPTAEIQAIRQEYKDRVYHAIPAIRDYPAPNENWLKMRGYDRIGRD